MRRLGLLLLGTLLAVKPCFSQVRQVPRWKRLRSWATDEENRKKFASMGAAGVLSYGMAPG